MICRGRNASVLAGASHREVNVLGHAAVLGNDAQHNSVGRVIARIDGVFVVVVFVTIAVDLAYHPLP